MSIMKNCPVTMSMLRHAFVGAVMLGCLTVAGAEWRLALEDTFERADLGNNWTPLHDIQWAVNNGVLEVDAIGEAVLLLNKTFKAPAVKVEYDCQADVVGFSDLTVVFGLGTEKNQKIEKGIFFAFACENNGGSRIVVPGDADRRSDHTVKAEIGKRHHVVAEANGTILTLRVDGVLAAQKQIPAPMDPGNLGLYVWRGKVCFDNFRVFVKDEADPPKPLEHVPGADRSALLAKRHYRVSEVLEESPVLTGPDNGADLLAVSQPIQRYIKRKGLGSPGVSRPQTLSWNPRDADVQCVQYGKDPAFAECVTANVAVGADSFF